EIEAAGIQVNKSFYGWSEYSTKQKLAMSENGGEFDLVFLSGIGAQRGGDAESLHSLDNYMNEVNVDKDDDHASDSKYAKTDGSWIVAPFASEAMVYYYRTDLYEEAGVEPPKTFEELHKTCSNMTGDGTSGLAIPAAPGDIASTYWSYFFWSEGGEYF